MSPAARDRRKTVIPVLTVSAVAWVVLVARASGQGLQGSCCVPASISAAFSTDSLRMLFDRNPPVAMLGAWALMLVAMMAPMLAHPIRHVLDRTLARRRIRSVALFVSGYFAVWMLAGAVILGLSLIARLLTPSLLWPVVIVGVVAFVWQCSPPKQYCLNRAHAHPDLAPFGRSADIAALKFGAQHAFWCVGTCGAMVWLSEMVVTGHLFAMGAVMLWQFGESIERPAVPTWRLRGVPRLVRFLAARPSSSRRIARVPNAI